MCIYPTIHPLHLFPGLLTMALTTTQCHHRAPPTHLPLSTFSTNPSSFSNLSFSSSSSSHHKLSISKNYTYGYGNAQFKIRPKNKVPAFYNHSILHVLYGVWYYVCLLFYYVIMVFDMGSEFFICYVLQYIVWLFSVICVARIEGYVCAKCAIKSYDIRCTCIR